MTNDNSPLRRTILKHRVASANLGQERSIRIYLPQGFEERSIDPGTSYPVIYCQDGEQAFNFGRIATIASQLIAEHRMEPVIIVGVDVDVKVRTSEYAPDGERFPRYSAFFAEELIPYVENLLPVRRYPEGRILLGDSLGGSVSLHLALDYPTLFRKVIAFSGAFFEPTQQRIQAETELSDLALYMLVGLQETEVGTERGTFDFVQLNRETFRILTAKGAKVAYFEEDGKHLWGFWQKYMADALLCFLHTD